MIRWVVSAKATYLEQTAQRRSAAAATGLIAKRTYDLLFLVHRYSFDETQRLGFFPFSDVQLPDDRLTGDRSSSSGEVGQLKVDHRVGRQGRCQKVVVLRHIETGFQGVCRVLCAALEDRSGKQLLKSLRDARDARLSMFRSGWWLTEFLGISFRRTGTNHGHPLQNMSDIVIYTSGSTSDKVEVDIPI